MNTGRRYFVGLTGLVAAALMVALPTVHADTVMSQASGNWGDAGTWDPGVPGALDDVYIQAGHTVTNSGLSAIAVNSLSVTGVLTHANNTTAHNHSLYVQVSGNLSVHASGRIDADAKGYAEGEGLGTCTGGSSARRSGASHGGRGAQGSVSSSVPGPTYGSVTAPTDIGSGGCSYGSYIRDGGGAIRLEIGGTTQLDGLITANGTNEFGTANSGGSGGSVYLTTSDLAGSGVIRANGGDAENQNGNCGGGGGGRIAVVLTGSETYGSVSMYAYGGTNVNPSYISYSGAAGTIYQETQSQGHGHGTLVLDNNGINGNRKTEISSDVTDASVGDVVIQNSATLWVNTNATLIVNGTFSNDFAFAFQDGSTVQLGSTNTFEAFGAGDVTFYTLICTNGGKTVLVPEGTTWTVEDSLTLTGDGSDDLVLRSASEGTQWNLSVKGTAAQDVDYVDVKDSDAFTGYGTQVTATHSIDSGNNDNWFFASVGLTNTWIGATDTSWSEPSNWDLGRAPLETDAAVIISNGCSHYPVLQTTRSVPVFEMLSGSSFTLDGNDLDVLGDATIAGSLIASSSEAIRFLGDVDFTDGSLTAASSTAILGGDAAQSITSDGIVFHVLQLTNTSDVITFTDQVSAYEYVSDGASSAFGDGLVADHVWFEVTGTAATQTFAVGSTSTIQDLYVEGAPGANQYLRSAGAGTWNLNVSGIAYVHDADAEYSDASGGGTIHPISCADSGNNLNWSFATTWKEWTGDADSDFAAAGNWSPSGAPGASDYVLIDDPDAAIISTPTTVHRMVIGGSTAASLTANALLTLQEDLHILTGGRLTHGNNTTAHLYSLNVVATGDVRIAVGGRIEADGKGFQNIYGPGSTQLDPGDTGDSSRKRSGASYGGRGALGAQGLPGPTYGSIVEPTDIGSGGSYYGTTDGGGAIKLDVAGSAYVDGSITADGTNIVDGTANSGGSGGSVWLTASALEGSGTIQAVGGAAQNQSGNCGAGGGGRVAVTLTNSSDFGLVTIEARGGRSYSYTTLYGAAGSVYLRTQRQGLNAGTLIIDNNGAAGNLMTDISSLVTDAEVGDLLIRDTGKLNLTSNQTLTVNGSLTNVSTFVTESGSTLVLAGTNSATIHGALSCYGLSCTSGGKTVTFQDGVNQTVEEALTLQGTGADNLVLRSTAPGNAWGLSVQATAVQTVQYVDVQDSDASVGYATVIVASDSTDSGNNTFWTFASAGVTNTWIGAVDTDWTEAGNWDQGRPPIPGDLGVVISNGCTHYPVLQTARTVSDFVMNTGSSLTLAGNDFTVEGDADLGGSVVASGTEAITFLGDVDFTGSALMPASSTVVIGGAALQSVTSGSVAFENVLVTNASAMVTFVDALSASSYTSTAASVTFGDGVDVGKLWVESAGSVVTQTFASGSSSDIEDLYFIGESGATLHLRSSGAGAWDLNVENVVFAKYVDVQNSDASGGKIVHAYSSADGGGNTDWIFGGNLKVWTGDVDGDFATAGNWSPGGVPAAGDYVLIDDLDPVTNSSDVTVYRVIIGGTTHSTLEANGLLTLQEDLQVLPGGWLTHGNNTTAENYKLNVVVTGDLTVAQGGVIDVVGRGYEKRNGPGEPGDKRAGASYGGRGGTGFDGSTAQTPGDTYGSVLAPTNIGSGGSQFSTSDGGGAVGLTVQGTARIEGEIRANGTNTADNAGSGGSGGSIYLTAGALTGEGVIQANGGPALDNDTGAGGGGRVAIYLTGSESFGDVSIQAYAGAKSVGRVAGAGTVYLEKSSEAGGYGTVVIDNNGEDAGNYCQYPAVQNPGLSNELYRAVLVVTNTNTRLDITTDIARVSNLLVYAGCQLNLGSSLLRVYSFEHPLDDLEGEGAGGTDRVDVYEQIIWTTPPAGSMFRFR